MRTMFNKIIFADSKPFSFSSRFAIKAPTLLEDLRNAPAYDHVPAIFDWSAFSDIGAMVIRLLTEKDERIKNPYHNAKHGMEVYMRAMWLAKELGLDTMETQVLLLAALFHDFDHCGDPVRNDGSGMTNEEVAASHADAFAKDIGLNLEQRIRIHDLIISTTYADPEIRPKTLLEQVLCFADISGFTKELTEWINETERVLLEVPKDRWPKDFREWNEQKIAFLERAGSLRPDGVSPQWNRALQLKLTLLKQHPERIEPEISGFLKNGRPTPP